MTEENVHLYEGMFLFNIQEIGGSLEKAADHLQDILARAEADVVAMARWDERKLAYEIKGQKRGLYLLAHFKVRPSQVANIERDVNLSEMLLRCLILRADHIGDTELEAALAEAAKLADHVALASGSGGDEEAQAPPAAVATEVGDDKSNEQKKD